MDQETWQELADAGYKVGERMLYLKYPPFRGDDIRTLQFWLKTLGFYHYNENGIFCEKTHKALLEFQNNMNIDDDGIVGEETIRNLKNLERIIMSRETSNFPLAGNTGKAKKLQEAPLTIGAVPEKVKDPIMIKVFGMIDELIKVGKVEELEVMDRFEGFSAAPGVAEGAARVITSFEDFPKLQAGDILVCPYTATAWTPIFPKIKAVVTDTGGMLTHAAITAREYRIPAVVGTWRATRSIKDGDIIRVDGNAGIVEVLKKAGK